MTMKIRFNKQLMKEYLLYIQGNYKEYEYESDGAVGIKIINDGTNYRSKLERIGYLRYILTELGFLVALRDQSDFKEMISWGHEVKIYRREVINDAIFTTDVDILIDVIFKRTQSVKNKYEKMEHITKEELEQYTL